GISGHAAHVEGIAAQDFRHHGDEHVVGALPDLGSAAEHGDLAAAVEQQLHAALRHLVPVDRQPGAAEVRAAGQAYAATVWQFFEFAIPIRACDDLPNALGETDRADLQPVRRERIRLGDDPETKHGRVHAELLRDLVELHFLAEARLRRAVAALGPAGRLVADGARRVELEARPVE